MPDEKSPPSWWSTLPGVITALATLLGAVGGLILALNAAHFFDKSKAADTNAGSSITQNSDSGQKPRMRKQGKGESAQDAEGTVAKNRPEEPAGNAAHWTNTVPIRNMVLHYNSADGSALMTDSGGAVLKSYPPDGFSPGWTHIVPTPHGTLFYNASTGRGAVVRFKEDGSGNTIKAYPSPGAPAFAKGWTSITNTAEGLVFFNAANQTRLVGHIDSLGNFH